MLAPRKLKKPPLRPPVAVAGLTRLQSASVAGTTQRGYVKLNADVHAWRVRNGMLEEGERAVDRMLSEYFDELYMDGEAADLGEKTLAAFVYHNQHYGKGLGCQLVGARQALRGWRRLRPASSRLPLPVEVVSMLSNQLQLMGHWEAALVTLLSCHCYFRPSEPFRLRVQDAVAPVAGSARYSTWCLTLHASELGVSSKTHEYDESVIVDTLRLPHLGHGLERLKRGKTPDQLLFTLTQDQMAKQFRAAVDQLNLRAYLGEIHVYQLRHSGASSDFLEKIHTLAEVQRRGRWRTAKSVRRYEKGGRVAQQFQKLPAPLQVHALRCAEHVGQVVSGALRALAPP